MPIKEGNERLQVSFPTELKNKIIDESKRQGISFQKLMIKICEEYITNASFSSYVSKPKSMPSNDDPTIRLVQEIYLLTANMDEHQRKFFASYLKQILDIGNTIYNLSIDNKKEDGN